VAIHAEFEINVNCRHPVTLNIMRLTSMSIEQLKALVAPPDTPSEVGTLSQWRDIERSLGVKLPTDYREFVFAYGSGLFAGFYRVYNPFASSQHSALFSSVTRVCKYNRESQQKFPGRFPFPYYPEKTGLLPWGNDENGNDYFWQTSGPPDAWHVVEDENRGNGIKSHAFTFTEFLISILNNETEPLAGGYPTEEDYVFESWADS